MDNLVKLVEELKIAVDGKKGEDAPSILDTVLTQVESGEKGVFELCIVDIMCN